MSDHITEITIFTALFLLVSGLGFVAARWRRPDSMASLDQWGLGGRGFGSWITWFLIGGDLYTAYTFVAVPALLFGAGAAGFFALPYTTISYPLVMLVLIRLWSVSHVNGFVTPADFVRARFGSPLLALLVAITGIVATMPYIALQLVGIQATLKAMGVPKDLPLIIAFVILAAYTYQSGLRAPALIAFIKDLLVYAVIIVAIVYIPHKLGGWGHVFDSAQAKFDKTPLPSDGTLLNSNNQINYVTLAFGSALALFMYPHAVTGVLASKNRSVIKRNMSALPAYSLLLGLIALLGFMAIAAGIKPITSGGKADTNTIVPLLFDQTFPNWFAGIAFAAIGIGALVPASIMSIGAANLFTRNIYRAYLRRNADEAEEARVSKLASLIVKLGAIGFILLIDPQFSIDLQLIGGAIILQTLPAVGLGVFTRWFHRGGLVLGWAAGMASALWMIYKIPNPAVKEAHFAGTAFPLSDLGMDTKQTVYAGALALLVNLVVAVVISAVLKLIRVPDGVDTTRAVDYVADEGDPRADRGTGEIEAELLT